LAVGKVFAALPPILAVNAIEPLSAAAVTALGLTPGQTYLLRLYRPVSQSGNSHLWEFLIVKCVERFWVGNYPMIIAS
jgi:hypothetical protein